MEKINDNFIYNIRMKYNIKLKDLSYGLCSTVTTLKIEKGVNDTNYLLKMRLLNRLGNSSEEYEYFLNSTEYKSWQERNSIINSIINHKLDKSEALLLEYEKNQNNNSNNLKKQFYFVMQGQFMIYKDSSYEDIYRMFKTALDLTVPDFDYDIINSLILSPQEINILLECEKYKNSYNEENYKRIIKYIENSCFDAVSKAQVYPKAVYYFCSNIINNIDKYKLDKNISKRLIYAVDLCNKSIKYLVQAKKLFYLWEIVESCYCIFEYIKKFNIKIRNKIEIENKYKSIKKLKQYIYENYDENSISKGMENFCYLYIESGVYNINDIIYIRRNMLNLTRRQLSEGICSEKTISQIEKGYTNSHKAIVKRLFKRLNIPNEFQMTELTANDIIVNELSKELLKYIDEADYKKADRTLNYIRKFVSEDVLSNKLFIKRYEVIINFGKGIITKEIYINELSKLLDKTLNINNLIDTKMLYMTSAEIQCLYDIIQNIENNDKRRNKYISILFGFCKKFENEENVNLYTYKYELAIKYLIKYFTNMGNYDILDIINKKTTYIYLKNKKMYLT